MENWSTHSEHPDILVSDQGRVARLLKTDTPSKNGYARVNVKNRAGKHVVRLVHQLVLEAFVGPRPSRTLTRHINDIKMDNRLENLRWGTPSENTQDAYDNGGRVLLKKCPLGHRIEGKNLQAKGRRCKACNQERANAHWHGREFDEDRAHARYKEVIG